MEITLEKIIRTMQKDFNATFHKKISQEFLKPETSKDRFVETFSKKDNELAK